MISTPMFFSKIIHRTDRSRERLEGIIAQLTNGKDVPSTQAVMIRAIAMNPPFENYSYLGVDLVDRSEWSLPPTGDAFISEQAMRLLMSFDECFPSGPIRGVGTITRVRRRETCEVDLSPKTLFLLPARFNGAAEGKCNWVIPSDVLGSVRTRAEREKAARFRVDSPSEEEFMRRSMELLNRMYELGYGDATYPVIRGDIIWEKGEITRRYHIGKSEAPGKPKTKKVPTHGYLCNGQKELLTYLRSLPACTNASISIAFRDGKPTDIKQTGRIHEEF